MICVGTAALGCPAEQSSAVGILVKCGCSDVFRDRLNAREFRIGNLARQELASLARPDSRGRLSPRELFFRPNAHDLACTDLPDLSADLQRDRLAQVYPGDRIRLDLAVYFYSFLPQL